MNDGPHHSARSGEGAPESPANLTPTPAEADLRTTFLDFLQEQRFHPGELIGNERALAAQFDVTRNHLRQVIDELEQQNLVRRVLGRSGGLFMSDKLIQRHLNTILGVPEMVRRQGLVLRTVVLAVTEGEPLPDERRALKLAEPDTVIRIQRLRIVEERPWSLDLSVFPVARFPGIAKQDFTGSLYELVHREYGVDIDWAEEAVSVVSAPVEEAQLLEIVPGAGVMSIWRTAYEESGSPFEFAHDLFRADRTRLQMQKFGTNWKRTVRRTKQA